MKLLHESRRALRSTILAAAAVTGLLASQASAKDLKIAFFASASQNGFNQAVWSGIQKKAKEIGGIEVSIYDGQFDPVVQYSQVEDVLAGGNFDGMILYAQDTVGIAGAAEQVIAKKVPLVAVMFPIGPDLGTLEPQIPGLTATVGHVPAIGATAQAESVAEFCKDKDPCRVVILLGFKVSPFDQIRLGAYEKVFANHPNIKVVATAEGQYSPDVTLTAMQDIMQANSEFEAVLSVADQQLIGVEIALKGAGIDMQPLFLAGAGGSTYGVDAVRQGNWDNTLAYFPETMGYVALDTLVASIQGKEHKVAIDMDVGGPVPFIITKEVLDKTPSFLGEWAQ
ncbi:MAG: sugar ABC transporter substrate-binding protein [Rhizobiaceae bacterium]